ncbi:hypothetical protein TNCV_711881 [Trichonephila clavipes]|nr:hypothetical protein TNCV_711881 [Trichonephila clavipes]
MSTGSYLTPNYSRSQSRETVLASSFYSQYGLPTISGLPLHDGNWLYRPEKFMTDSPKDLSQLVAIYFVVFQCLGHINERLGLELRQAEKYGTKHKVANLALRTCAKSGFVNLVS